MSKRKNDAFSEAVVGLFMVAVFALLVYFTIVISGVDVLKGREKVFANVTFSAVGGLKSHDSVMYRGTKVGAVEDIEITASNLVVRVEIDRSVVLREGYRIAVCNLSMLGGNFLLLEEGEGAVIDVTAAPLRGETPSDWMQDVATIAKNLNELTSRVELKTIITNLEATSAVAKRLVDRLDRGEGTLGKLLSADDTLYADARRTVANAAAISDRLHQGEGTVGRLLVDEALYANLTNAVAAFQQSCESLRLPGDFGAQVGELTVGANRLIDNLNTVVERLKQGEGTLGKLAAESALYDETEALIRDVRQIIDNYRDTTPISTFGSLIMGGL